MLTTEYAIFTVFLNIAVISLDRRLNDLRIQPCLRRSFSDCLTLKDESTFFGLQHATVVTCCLQGLLTNRFIVDDVPDTAFLFENVITDILLGNGLIDKTFAGFVDHDAPSQNG